METNSSGKVEMILSSKALSLINYFSSTLQSSLATSFFKSVS